MRSNGPLPHRAAYQALLWLARAYGVESNACEFIQFFRGVRFSLRRARVHHTSWCASLTLPYGCSVLVCIERLLSTNFFDTFFLETLEWTSLRLVAGLQA